MKKHESFGSDFPDPGGNRGADVSLADMLRAGVLKIHKASEGLPVERVLSEVESFFGVVTAQPFSEWSAQTEAHANARKRLEKAARSAQARVDSGEVPQHLDGDEDYRLPTSPWRRAAIFFLFIVSVLVSTTEWFNFAAFQAPTVDSMAISLTLSLPILILPIAESVLLRGNHFTPAGRKRITLVQGILGVLAGCAYLYYSFIHADTSLATMLTPQNQWLGLSSEAIRMAFQILASVSLSAVCLDGALSLGVGRPAPNPDYDDVKSEIAGYLLLADRHAVEISTINGWRNQLNCLKDEQLAFTRNKWARLEAEREKFNQNIKNILDQKS